MYRSVNTKGGAHTSRRIGMVLMLLVFFLSMSCESADSTFSRRVVSFNFSPTTSVPVLHTALNSINEFVTIRISGGKFIFSSMTARGEWPMSEIDKRTTAIGLSGFIVGMPAIPELGAGATQPVCYELSCPNCYAEYHFTRDVTLQEGGKAQCDRCGRTYDLSNQGMICSGEKGSKLDRYRITYAGNAVSIR